MKKSFMIALVTLAMKMDIVLIMRKVGKEEKCKHSYHDKNDFYVVLFYSKMTFKIAFRCSVIQLHIRISYCIHFQGPPYTLDRFLMTRHF